MFLESVSTALPEVERMIEKKKAPSSPPRHSVLVLRSHQ